MKGRLNVTLWRLIVVDVVALFAVLLLAYDAGQIAHVSIANLGSLPAAAGYRLLFAFFICLAAGTFTLFTIDNRVLTPMKNISEFAERFSQGDLRARAAVETPDDFGLLAEQLNRAAENSSRAMYNQEAQEAAEERYRVPDHRQPDCPGRPHAARPCHHRRSGQRGGLGQLHA